jgi:hypothetical protein
VPSEFDANQAIKNRMTTVAPAELYKLIDDRYIRWLDHTAGLRNQWRLNSLFAQGFQWAALQPSQNKVILPPTTRSRRRITFNLIKPWLLDTEAKLDVALPTFDVTPNNTAQANKDAAKAAESYGQHLWRQLEMREKYRQIVRHSEHYGGCFGVLDWDETIGPLYSRRQQLPDGSGPSLVGGKPQDEMFTLGDIRYDIYSPDNVITDEENTDLDEKPYIILASWMSLDNIREKWDDGHLVLEEKRAQPQFDTMGMMDMATGIRGKAMQHGDGQGNPGALVFKMYMKPQHSASNGLVTTFANGQELEKSEWPEEFAKMEGYPVVKYDWYRHPHVFRGESPLVDQIPIQREINVTISQIRENLDMILALKWLNPHGSGVDDINDIAGQIIDYVPGFKPEILQPGSIPAFVPRHLDFLMAAMEDVQILHKPSKGKVPAGVKSGVGIELLQEQDDRPLSVPENNLHASLDKTFTKALQIASVAVATERMIQYVGPNKRRQVLAFKGADLRDNTNIHLSVVGGSSKSKTGIIKRIMEFVQLGMYRKEGGGVDTNRVMEMVRVAHPDVMYEEEDRHKDLAQDENDMLWDPQAPPPVPQEWEMHNIHLDELELEMNTIKWKQQVQKDPAFGQKWIAHREGHLQYIIVASQRAGQNALALQGQLAQQEQGGEAPASQQ